MKKLRKQTLIQIKSYLQTYFQKIQKEKITPKMPKNQNLKNLKVI